MRQTLPLIVCSFFAFLSAISAQKDSKETQTALLSAKDTLLLKVTNGKKLVMHPVKAKQTFYSISKYYSLSLEELYEHNPQFRSDPTLRVGSQVKIPIPNLAIKRYKTKKFTTSQNVPIYYVVQEGDNLYQICKRNFGMEVDSVIKRNKLKGTAIKPGQYLLVAWMGTEGVKQEWRPAKQSAQSSARKTQYGQEKTNKKEIVVSHGVCIYCSENVVYPNEELNIFLSWFDKNDIVKR